MTERESFVHGGTTYPLGTNTGNSSLRDADPSLYYTIAFFASVLQTYLGARLVAEAAAAGLTGPNVITKAVTYALPYDPITVLQEQQFAKFPLLAVWRTTDKNIWRTIGRMQSADVWKVAYVLPPITGAQRERLQPLLKAAKEILLNRIENMGDPNFLSGAQVWKLANLDEINLVGGNTGHYELPKSELVLPAWVGDLSVIEGDQPIPESATGGPLTGVDLLMDLVSSDGTVIPDFVDAGVDFPTFTGQLGAPSSMPGSLEPGAP